MLRAAIIFAIVMLASSHAWSVERARRDTVPAMDCRDSPIELGIVLDSSVSIPKPDFNKAKAFLQDLVSHFKIGPDDTRVSLILYGNHTYPDQAFDLDTYTNSADLDAALAAIVHQQGKYTSTGEGIDYMRDHQLSADKVRAGIARVAVVITDGNSQEGHKTSAAAAAAAANGIEMVAVGVGHAVQPQELLNIAVGNQSNVITAASFSDLEVILAPLQKQLCVPVPVLLPPTPPPQTVCELSAADLYFVFSQKSLGLEKTSVTVDFINAFMAADDYDRAFRYGVISDKCDSGFDIGYYNRIDSISDRLQGYEQYTLPSLVEQLVTKAYPRTCSASAQGKVAVIFSAQGQKTAVGIQDQVTALVDQGVQVFLVDLTGSGVQVTGAHTVSGTSAVTLAHQLLQILCH